MKIFFYDFSEIFPQISAFQEQAVNRHRIAQQYRYFLDIQDALRRFKTTDHNDADYFFVPLFLAAWQFQNVDPEAYAIISKYCQFASRRNHLLVATGDFGQRRQSRHEMQTNPERAYRDKYSWLDNRFKLLALESTSDLDPGDIAFFPYMTEEPDPALNFRKSILASFKGVISHPHLDEAHIRGGVLRSKIQHLAQAGVLVYDSDAVEGLGALSSRALMARSLFSLCPAGYGRWTYRLIEALRHNSIPVLLSDDYELPFSKRIDWNRYILHLPESSIGTLGRTLGDTNSDEVASRLRAIEDSQELFTREHCLSLLVDSLAAKTLARSVEWVLPRMRTPSEMGIICIDITNKCDLACSNCTRLLENQDTFWEMSPENFRIACRSLIDYQGIVAVIGGNPCMHSRFPEIAQIFEDEFSNRRQRGIWTNNAFKHSGILKEKFGAFNLNPHGVERGIKSLQPIHEEMVIERKFSGGYYPESSEHAPLLVAVRDVFPEEEMWERIARCDINKDWSASIIQNKGRLRAYFCEVAAAFDLARNEDHGIEVTRGWWKKDIGVFAHQVEKFCPGCGAPARLKGSFDYEEVDTYSTTNEDIVKKSVVNKKRKVLRIHAAMPGALGHRVTKYEKNAS